MSKAVALRDGLNGREFVLRGRTSRTLTDGHGYIFDDVSIQAFRETIAAQPYMTTKDVYVGDWLGLYTEVVIDRATGHVDSTLVEID